jgi:hypothetical protein
MFIIMFWCNILIYLFILETEYKRNSVSNFPVTQWVNVIHAGQLQIAIVQN